MQSVRYFLILCEELNFTRAAERCNVAQPSLTRAISSSRELGRFAVSSRRANTHLSELGRTLKPIWNRSCKRRGRQARGAGIRGAAEDAAAARADVHHRADPSARSHFSAVAAPSGIELQILDAAGIDAQRSAHRRTNSMLRSSRCGAWRRRTADQCGLSRAVPRSSSSPRTAPPRRGDPRQGPRR